MTLSRRPATLDDAGAIHALWSRADEADQTPARFPLSEVESFLAWPHADRARDSLLVESEGDAVAFSNLLYVPSEVVNERIFTFGIVDPEYRGRGIGSELMRWQVHRGSEILRASETSIPKLLRTFTWEWRDDARSLFERHGFEIVRYFDLMMRDLSQPIPPTRLPADVRLVAWSPEFDEAARLCHNAAFVDHWGSTPMDAGMWAHRLDSEDLRREMSLVALVGEGVVGYLHAAVAMTGLLEDGGPEGWVELLGVHPDWRGRGMATALLNEAMRRFGAEGIAWAVLDVDHTNETGANRLYESVGFGKRHRSVTYDLTV